MWYYMIKTSSFLSRHLWLPSEHLSGFGQLLVNLRKSLKSDRKSSENRCHKYVHIILGFHVMSKTKIKLRLKILSFYLYHFALKTDHGFFTMRDIGIVSGSQSLRFQCPRLALSIHSQNMGAGLPENHQPQACKPRLETVKETRTHLLEWFGA